MHYCRASLDFSSLINSLRFAGGSVFEHLRLVYCVATLAVVTGCVLIPYEPDAAVREGESRINFVYDPEKVEAVDDGDSVLWHHIECVRAEVQKADPRYSVVQGKTLWGSMLPNRESVRWEELFAEASSSWESPTFVADYIAALHVHEYYGGRGPAAWAYGAPAGPFALTEGVITSVSLMSIEEQKVVAAFEAEAVGKAQGAWLFIAGVGTMPLTHRAVCRKVAQTLIDRLVALTEGRPARLALLPAQRG